MPNTITTTPQETDTASRLRAVVGKVSRRLHPTAAALAAGLTPTQSSILLAVVRRGPTRLSELAASEGVNPTMLSRVIAELVDGGLLERSSDAGDRRAAWVKATATGRRLSDRVRRERALAIWEALAKLPEADRRGIERALPALERLAEQLPGATR